MNLGFHRLSPQFLPFVLLLLAGCGSSNQAPQGMPPPPKEQAALSVRDSNSGSAKDVEQQAELGGFPASAHQLNTIRESEGTGSPATSLAPGEEQFARREQEEAAPFSANICREMPANLHQRRVLHKDDRDCLRS